MTPTLLIGTVPGVAATVGGTAMMLHGAHGAAGGIQGMANALNGTNHGGLLEQMGAHFFGEKVGQVGKTLDTLVSARGIVKGLHNLYKGSDAVGDLHSGALTFKKVIDNNQNFCPGGG